MDLKYKRIVAKEFLALVAVLLLTFLFFLSLFIYNFYHIKEIDKIDQLIISNKNKANALSAPYHRKKLKQGWFLDKFEFPPSYPKEPFIILYQISQADSIKIKWDNKWKDDLTPFLKEIGFNTPSSFKNFVDKNYITKTDMLNYKQSNRLNEDIKVLSFEKGKIAEKIISNKDQVNIILLVSCILISLLFFARYFYYAIRWSVSTISEK